jgi:hypothetical protein
MRRPVSAAVRPTGKRRASVDQARHKPCARNVEALTGRRDRCCGRRQQGRPTCRPEQQPAHTAAASPPSRCETPFWAQPWAMGPRPPPCMSRLLSASPHGLPLPRLSGSRPSRPASIGAFHPEWNYISFPSGFFDPKYLILWSKRFTCYAGIDASCETPPLSMLSARCGHILR